MEHLVPEKTQRAKKLERITGFLASQCSILQMNNFSVAAWCGIFIEKQHTKNLHAASWGR